MDTIDRARRRLLTQAGQGMVWLSTAALAGGLTACGGGAGDDDPTDPGSGGGSSGGGGGGGGSAIDAAVRAATLTAVADAVSASAAGAARFDAETVAAALRAMPSLAEVGVSAALGNVWARFSDGQWLVLPNALMPPARTGQAATPRRTALSAGRRQAAAAGELDTPSILTEQQYRQIDMLGGVPLDGSEPAAHLCQDWVDADTLPALRRMAVGLGFNLPQVQLQAPPDSGVDNGVEGLREIGGDGIFFLTAQCGQAGPDGDPRTVICTRTPATEANLQRYARELSEGSLVHAVQLVAVDGAWLAQPCLALTPAFVTLNRWRFPDRCIGILNLAGAPALNDWGPVLNAAGLRHILAWAQPAPWPRMLAFADDLVQLNLATNKLDGTLRRQTPTPRLRSYGMAETREHLIERGVAGGDGLPYLQEPQPALYVNTWMPTIDQLILREGRGELELVGQFGAAVNGDPGMAPPAPHLTRTSSAQVLFGSEGQRITDPPGLDRAADPRLAGTESRSTSLWEGGLIQLDLGEDELARGGYIQVINGGRASNAVPITHWEIPLEVLTTVDELTLRITVSLRLRADVHPWRLRPGDTPRDGQGFGEPMVSLEGSVHSRMDFTASGSISHYDASQRKRTTVSWSGSGGAGNRMGSFVVSFSGLMRWTPRVVDLVVLNVASVLGYQQRTVIEQFDINGALLTRSESDVTRPVTATTAGPGLSGLMTMAFDERWALLPGRFELLPVPSSVLPSPPERQQRTVVSWPEVMPDFPPRDDHGGS